jgi:hypothetical protein
MTLIKKLKRLHLRFPSVKLLILFIMPSLVSLQILTSPRPLKTSLCHQLWPELNLKIFIIIFKINNKRLGEVLCTTVNKQLLRERMVLITSSSLIILEAQEKSLLCKINNNTLEVVKVET